MLRRLSEVVPVALGLKKSPKDIVLSSVESFKTLQAHRAFLRPDSSNSANNSESEEDYTYNRAVEDLSKNLQAMKCILYGESDNEEPRKNEAMELASIMVSSHFLLLLVQYMECLDLEVCIFPFSFVMLSSDQISHASVINNNRQERMQVQYLTTSLRFK